MKQRRPSYPNAQPRITAVLGPTNTGKTHYAIERMLGHRNGIFGLPLRLLAREVYDKVIQRKGIDKVALITGEEKIHPPGARYLICTVEAMPDIRADFLAVDEIQLAANTERGHIFTDRLLHARGYLETIFIGSETIKLHIQTVVPEAQILFRHRFSQLSYAGRKKLAHLPSRTAIVAYSAEDVYAIAEFIRQYKGGAAVVMGALSPRTRNAQVSMFESGEVDYIVATDAIGMGLNLSINHVAFASLRKFDGVSRRQLFAHEIGQVAGRAGRYTVDGTFGTTGDAQTLDENTFLQIENHTYQPIRALQYRNSSLVFSSIRNLLNSLEKPPPNKNFVKTKATDDLLTLRALYEDPSVAELAKTQETVGLLWATCGIPDFRKLSRESHVRLVGHIFYLLTTCDKLPNSWLEDQVRRLHVTTGDIDTLQSRLAAIRTWSFVSNRPGWTEDPKLWQERTSTIETALSDALHQALIKRFVDRRSTFLSRRLKQKGFMRTALDENGTLLLEGYSLGRIKGFQFLPDHEHGNPNTKPLRNTYAKVLGEALGRQATSLINASATELTLNLKNKIAWRGAAVGIVRKGSDILHPKVVLLCDDQMPTYSRKLAADHLTRWLQEQINDHFSSLLTLGQNETLSSAARGLVFRLVESLGIVPVVDIQSDLTALEKQASDYLIAQGVRFGRLYMFMPTVLKLPHRRLAVCLFAALKETMPILVCSSGQVSYRAKESSNGITLRLSGYHATAGHHVRIDVLESFLEQLHLLSINGGILENRELLSYLGIQKRYFVDLMKSLGFSLSLKDGNRAYVLRKKKQNSKSRTQHQGKKWDPNSPFATLRSFKQM